MNSYLRCDLYTGGGEAMPTVFGFEAFGLVEDGGGGTVAVCGTAAVGGGAGAAAGGTD